MIADATVDAMLAFVGTTAATVDAIPASVGILAAVATFAPLASTTFGKPPDVSMIVPVPLPITSPPLAPDAADGR